MPDTPTYLFDGVHNGSYVRAWRVGEGRTSEIHIQVWKNQQSADGLPTKSHVLPGMYVVTAAVEYAVRRTT